MKNHRVELRLYISPARRNTHLNTDENDLAI